MDLPNLYFVLLTYERMEYAEETLRTWLENLRYSGQLSVHIADDGSPEEHRQTLADLAGGFDSVQSVTVTNSERGGYGRSFNLAMQVTHLHAGVVIPCEDDWRLTQPLDLDPLVTDLLNEETPIDCIRLGYIGWTQEIRGRLVKGEGGTYLLFDPDSPERHVFAGHPRIETVEFERRAGEWDETLAPGATEFDVAGRVAARTGVAWPMDLMRPSGGFVGHIGTVKARTD